MTESRPEQLSLLDLTAPIAPGPMMAEDEFIARLSVFLPEPARIVLTHNRSTLISCRRDRDGTLTARVQHAFRGGDPAVLKALARFIHKPDRRSRRALDRFLAERHDLIESQAREARAPRPMVVQGQRRDLGRVLAKVKRDHGIKLAGIKITWAERRAGGRRHSIKFGSYYQRDRIIRVHPDLDREDVPDFFVEYIVYHELLHALFPPQAGADGRREVHSPEFARFERKFERYREARAFESFFVKHLLR